jgi:exodeoxyribonuclease V alpha subunit
MEADLQDLTGEVISQKTFDSGYAILRVELAKGNVATLVGDMPEFACGVMVAASAVKTEHPKYGVQYKVKDIKEKGFSSIEGVVNYLSGASFDGIGKSYARMVAEHFGSDALAILDESIEKIYDVPGLPQARAQSIEQQWTQNRAAHKLISNLIKYNVSVNLALKIHSHFEEVALEIVEKDSYRLTEIYGLGFQKADDIALKVGIPRDSESRVEAAIKYILENVLVQGGHCYMDHYNIGEQATLLLQGDANLNHVLAAIKSLISKGTLVLEDQKIYLSSIYESEKKVTDIISDLMQYKGKVYYKSIEDLDHDLKIVGLGDFTFSDEQKNAILSALNNRVFIITGGPGSGKTTITKAICRLMDYHKINFNLCSPTGRAAKRLMESTLFEAKTIHRLLKVSPDGGFEFNDFNPLMTDCVIIDETSMVDLLLFKHLLSALESNDRLILIGDVDQLPSVGPGNILKDLINSDKIPYVRLNKVFRQDAKSAIVLAAHDVIGGRVPELIVPSKSQGKNFMFAGAEKIDDVIGILKHLVQKTLPSVKINDKNLTVDDIQILTPMREKGLGVNDINPKLQEVLNPRADNKEEIQAGMLSGGPKIFRVGDRVMQIKNDYEKNVFNGDMGKIVGINKQTSPVQVGVKFPDLNEVVIYKQHELDDLQHAWCITVHKSQGGEFPAVIILAHDSQTTMLQRNLFYTGITRAKKICIVVGTLNAVKSAVNNTRETKRNTTLKDRLISKIK